MMVSACHILPQSDAVKLQWSTAATLPADISGKPHPGLAGAISGISNNFYIIGGGANFPDAMPWEGGQKRYHKKIFLYKLGVNGSLLPVPQSQELPEELAYAAVVTTPSGIIMAGGENKNGPSRSVWLCKMDVSENKLNFISLPSLPMAITNASAATLGETVFVAGGESPEGTLANAWKLNLNDTSAGWQALSSLPAPLSHSVMTAIEGKDGLPVLYIAGGRFKKPDGVSQFSDATYKFNPQNSKWEGGESLPYPLSAASGALSPSGKWIIFSGDRGKVFGQVEQLLAAIAVEKDSLRRDSLIHKKNDLQRTHPGFGKEVWEYDFAADKWYLANPIPFDGPVTTHAVRWENEIFIGSGEIRAGVRTPAIIKAAIKE